MSACVADGWSRPNCQSVSVVPTIHWSPQGSTNSTLFSVGMMRAYSESMRRLGARRRARPSTGRTTSRGLDAGQTLDVRGPHAGRVDDHAGAHLELVARLAVARPSAATRSPSRRKATTLDGGRADGAVGHRRAREHHREAGVVDLGVVVADRRPSGRRRAATGRRAGRRRATGAVPRHGRARPGEGVVEQEARAHVEPVPHAVLPGGRGRASGDQVRGELLHAGAGARGAPPAPAGSRDARDSAARRG